MAAKRLRPLGRHRSDEACQPKSSDPRNLTCDRHAVEPFRDGGVFNFAGHLRWNDGFCLLQLIEEHTRVRSKEP